MKLITKDNTNKQDIKIENIQMLPNVAEEAKLWVLLLQVDWII
jgi:hypothetical protein